MNDPILSRQHLVNINKGQAQLNEAVKIADKMESAGFDVADLRAQIDYYSEALSRIKRTFFPDQR